MQVSLMDPAVPRVDTLATPAPRVGSGASVAEGSSFAEVLHGLGREINRGEATMRAALGAMHGSMSGGADLGPERLIALQAGVYRYSEAIDLTSRLVDRATSGVKTIVQGGGQ